MTFGVAGDGDYTTPAVTTKGAGFYVWQEAFAADSDTGTPSVLTPCGVAEETTIVPATPELVTQASAQTAVVGASLSDTVTLTGALPGTVISGDFQLLGPVAPTSAGSCEGLSWSGAAVAAHGTFTITAGDDGTGTSTTDAQTVTTAGCFTFIESADATPTSAGIGWTAAGTTAETTLVKSQPALVTQAHVQQAKHAQVVFDLVTVSGTGGAAVPGQWRLLGLPAPHQGGCGAITPEQWAGAQVLAEGTFTANGDGTVKTDDVRMEHTLCVTYVEHGDETPTTAEIAWTTPGIPEETQLVQVGDAKPTGATVPIVRVPAGIAGGSASARPHGRPIGLGVLGLGGASGLCALVALALLVPRRHGRRRIRR